nr:hypothetical protein [Tanacetum cinerariifolium]
MSLLQEVLDGCAALARRVEHLEHDKVAQYLEIIKLKTRVKKLERANKVKALKLRRLRKVGTSQRVDTSDDTIMEDVSNQGGMIDELDRDEGAVSAAAVVPTVTAAPVKVAVPSTRQRRGVVIRDPEEESSAKTPTKTKSKDKGKGFVAILAVLVTGASQSRQHESCKSPTAELFDVNSGRISIVTVVTQKYHSDVLARSQG